MNALRDVAVVGVGQTDFGALYAERDAQRDAYALGAEAFRLALADSGLRKDEVDGLLTARIRYEHSADVLGIPNPRVLNALEGSGRMSGVAVQHAVSLIAAGQADTIALVVGELAVNSSKHGAIAHGGRIALSSQLDGGDIILVWHEVSKRAVQATTREGGQGLNLINRIVLLRDGAIDLDWQADGLTATLRFKNAAPAPID